jgi:hypothetical protein
LFRANVGSLAIPTESLLKVVHEVDIALGKSLNILLFDDDE